MRRAARRARSGAGLAPKAPTGLRRGVSRLPQPQGVRGAGGGADLSACRCRSRSRNVDCGQAGRHRSPRAVLFRPVPAGAGALPEPSRSRTLHGVRVASALRHGHRSSARPHDASREPLSRVERGRYRTGFGGRGLRDTPLLFPSPLAGDGGHAAAGCGVAARSCVNPFGLRDPSSVSASRCHRLPQGEKAEGFTPALPFPAHGPTERP